MRNYRKPSDKALRIHDWLRFSHKAPATHQQIEAATGLALTPDLVREGNELGIFVWSLDHKGFI